MQVTQASDLEQLFRQSGNRLWWSLLAYTGHPEIASDSMAEAFALALGATDTIRDPAAWVWRVAFRLATADLRAMKQRGSEAETTYEMDEQAVAVVQALQRLSLRQRAVFVLFYLEDRTTNQIGESLGIAPATVSVHLHRARRRLRSILGGDDD